MSDSSSLEETRLPLVHPPVAEAVGRRSIVREHFGHDLGELSDVRGE